MTYNYEPKGVCPSNISFDFEDGHVKNVSFTGGCQGNLIGLSKLTEGKTPDEIISILRGITCGRKPSSCPDQLTYAVEQAIKN